DLFYVFDRKACGEIPDQDSVDFVLLTANLVEDDEQQRNYVDLHERQFNEWPEVSQGFCQAGFREVLLYRHGRQLMLMITFPKGSDFNQLNAKTVENNPRVEEWNRLMSRFQERIPGTMRGETWVFFN